MKTKNETNTAAKRVGEHSRALILKARVARTLLSAAFDLRRSRQKFRSNSGLFRSKKFY